MTGLCPKHNVLSIYALCLFFLDIPTYPKIRHLLWMLPEDRTLLDMLLTLIFKSRKLSKIRQAVKLKLKSQGLLPNFICTLTNNDQNVIISVYILIIIVHIHDKLV